MISLKTLYTYLRVVKLRRKIKQLLYRKLGCFRLKARDPDKDLKTSTCETFHIRQKLFILYTFSNNGKLKYFISAIWYSCIIYEGTFWEKIVIKNFSKRQQKYWTRYQNFIIRLIFDTFNKIETRSHCYTYPSQLFGMVVFRLKSFIRG